MKDGIAAQILIDEIWLFVASVFQPPWFNRRTKTWRTSALRLCRSCWRYGGGVADFRAGHGGQMPAGGAPCPWWVAASRAVVEVEGRAVPAETNRHRPEAGAGRAPHCTPRHGRRGRAGHRRPQLRVSGHFAARPPGRQNTAGAGVVQGGARAEPGPVAAWCRRWPGRPCRSSQVRWVSLQRAGGGAGRRGAPMGAPHRG